MTQIQGLINQFLKTIFFSILFQNRLLRIVKSKLDNQSINLEKDTLLTLLIYASDSKN